jgi:N6-L-threonylcarbamoyladenine synthase
MLVLGIETSCDDTGVALVAGGDVLAARAVTQESHRRYLGVVPELASREHLRILFPLLHDVLADADRSLREVQGIAVTCGPGLLGCLLVGLSAAKGLAYSLGIPFVAVNHIHAHLMSARIEHEVAFPFIGMVVSGGHTEIYRVEGEERMLPLGTTRDDAAGEAFDKVAKLLGLGYPGGVAIDRLAEGGDPRFVHFPRAMLGEDSLDVSFSGLKTAVRNFLDRHRAEGGDETFRRNVAASFQRSVVDVLIAKLERALALHPGHPLVVAGGVACNSELRGRLSALASARSLPVHVPSPAYCGDNGAMVAFLGERLLLARRRSPLGINAYATLEEIEAARLYASTA